MARHLSKLNEKPKEFSNGSWGSQVNTYSDRFHGKNGMPEDCWKELVDVCQGKSEDEGDLLEADLSILDNDRAFVFDFCSPAKSRT